MALVGPIALALWLGGTLLFTVVVAPAAFAVLPSRALAGAVVGRVLPAVFVSGIVAALVMLALDTRLGLRFKMTRRLSVALLAASCAIAQFVVAPRIERLRASIGPALDALAASDPRRIEFGRLHAASVAWLGVGMLAAAAALTLGLMSHSSRPPDS
jgi:hypothetical protein